MDDYNFICDIETLQSFDETSRSLNIPAYGMQINNDKNDVFWLLKAIKLISLERSADGKRHGEVVKRVSTEVISFEDITGSFIDHYGPQSFYTA